MKRFGIFILIFCSLLLGGWNNCQAQSQFSDTLTRMEKSLFGFDYAAQNDAARLKRIEEIVYGSASSKSIQQRVNKLSKDLSADLIGQEIEPKKDTFTEDENNNNKESIPKADSSVNYPIVNSMEKNVFNKEFKTMEINQRLAKLEQKVLKKTYSDDLNSRVRRLKLAIMPETLAQIQPEENNENIYIPDDITKKFPKNYGGLLGNYGPQVPDFNTNDSILENYYGDSDISIPLANLEKKILRKSHPDDVLANRLIRLELKVFNSTFTGDDEQTRLDRIASAYQAKKSSKKYDSNKFAKHTATAMQVGAILLMILAAIL